MTKGYLVPGMSKIAHGVLASVAAEYLSNVGRTMRLMVDKYAQKMNAEEIILHTLFESGITEVQDLDRYVHDDVLRYGTRMGELEKKLVNAYAEAVSLFNCFVCKLVLKGFFPDCRCVWRCNG